MHANEIAEEIAEPDRPIKSVAFVANRAGAGATTLVAMLSMEAFSRTQSTISVVDMAADRWLRRWRRQAMWQPGCELDDNWDANDLRGPLVYPCPPGCGVGGCLDDGQDVGCEFGLIDAGVPTAERLGEVLATADFVVVVVDPLDEDGIAGRGVEAFLVSAAKPGAVVLNKADLGDGWTEAALSALRARGGLPLIAVVPDTDLAAAVLPRCLNHIEFGEDDASTLAVDGLWRELEARIPGLVPEESEQA